MTSVRAGTVVVVALVLCAPSVGHAQAADDTTEARLLFQEGRARVEAGDFEGALDRFERSYERVERASTALSIAVVAVELERPERAIEALDDLARIADPERDAAHLETGAELRGRAEAMLTERAPAPAPVEPRVAPEPPPAPPRQRGIDDGALIGSIALMAGGVALYAVAVGTFVASEDPLARRDAICPGNRCSTEAEVASSREAHDEADTLITTTNVLHGIAPALLVAGAAWLTIAIVQQEEDRPAIGIGPGVVTLAGTFR